jgi:hypothetical protein
MMAKKCAEMFVQWGKLGAQQHKKDHAGTAFDMAHLNEATLFMQVHHPSAVETPSIARLL